MKPAGHVEVQEEIAKAPILCSQRWHLATLCFFGFFFVYVMRVNLSVAIICMVRSEPFNLSGHAANLTQGSGNNTNILSEMEIQEVSLVKAFTASDTRSSCNSDVMQDASAVSYAGEFTWDRVIKSRMLAMYFYGYVLTQIPGGWLAQRYGGQKVWGVCQLISAICTLLTPVGARFSVYMVYAIRFILGLSSGVSFPCVHAMMGRWAPKPERSKLLAFCFSGPPLGTILAFSISALLCSYGFDNGWGSIFYLTGTGTLLWVAAWVFLTADTPSEHKRISIKERDYILHSIGEKPNTKKHHPIPWRAFLTSGPLWAIICAHVCTDYTHYTLLTTLPTFMKEVLKYDITQNGVLSSLPYLCQAITSLLVGPVADLLMTRNILSTTATRKVLQSISFLGIAVCIAVTGFLTCEQRTLAVVIICLCLAFMGINRAGYTINHIDLAPRHAGILFGITNSVAAIPGMIAPLVVGALTPNNTPEEWRRVFYICSAMATFGAMVFNLLADGELQSWSAPPVLEITYDDAGNVITTKEIQLDDTLRDKTILDCFRSEAQLWNEESQDGQPTKEIKKHDIIDQKPDINGKTPDSNSLKMDPGSLKLDPSSLNLDPSSLNLDHSSKTPDPNNLKLDPSSKTLDPSSKTLDTISKTLDTISKKLDS